MDKERKRLDFIRQKGKCTQPTFKRLKSVKVRERGYSFNQNFYFRAADGWFLMNWVVV